MAKRISDRTAALAAFVLAFTSLMVAAYHVRILIPLLNNGTRTGAIVSGFHRGARNSKWAIYRFTTDAGKTVTERDKFQLYIWRPDNGDQVTVIYDPGDISVVTADLGIWTWQGPAIFLFGFVFLAGTGILILHYKPPEAKNKQPPDL